MAEPSDLERVWDERAKVCMLTTRCANGLRARPLEARPDRKDGVPDGHNKSQGPAILVCYRVDFAGATAARAADRMAERPPFAPPAER